MAKETRTVMKTAGYIGSLLPDGHLSITPEVVRKLDLQPDAQVQVVLISLLSREGDGRRAEERKAVWRQIDALHERLSPKGFSLTDSLLQTREEEDASL